MSGYTIDGDLFKVLINAEGQYSLWPSLKECPNGWTEVGFVGSKEACSGYVDTHWTDMRPNSLKKSMGT